MHRRVTKTRFVIGTLLSTTMGLSVALADDQSGITAGSGFNVDPQPLASALRVFSDQSGLQVGYVATLAENLQSKGTTGRESPGEALSDILVDTGLNYVYVNDDTVAIAAVETGNSGANQSPVDAHTENLLAQNQTTQPTSTGSKTAPVQTSKTKKKDDKQEVVDESEKLEEVLVVGSRIRGRNDIQPVMTVGTVEIERTGAKSLGELLLYIPQFTNVNIGIPSSGGGSVPGIGSVGARVTADLRGASFAGTLLLVDGRRVPKTGQEFGNEAYDLSGIPINAIERVEVLLDGASSIYGADATGGVVNIVLKKNYSGTNVTLTYEDTFDSKSDVKAASIMYGFAANKFSGWISGNFEENSPLAATDRKYTASQDRRPYGGKDFRANLPPGGPGQVRSQSGDNLPGLDSSVAAIPFGSDGINNSIADFANAGPLGPADRASYYDSISSYKRTSFSAKMAYEVDTWLELFADARVSKNENWTNVGPVFMYNKKLPADYIGNPFGVPIILDKWLWDIPVEYRVKNDTQAYVVGGRGAIGSSWQYEATASYVESNTRENGASQIIDNGLLTAAIESSNPPVLIYDGTMKAPPSIEDPIRALFRDNNPLSEKAHSSILLFQADGPIAKWWGGVIKMAVGGEYRDEVAVFGTPPGNPYRPPSSDRQVSAVFAEFAIPLVNPEANIPALYSLDLSVSIRYDDYSDFGDTTNTRAGIGWRPVEWLLLRGSYGEGFKVPTLSQLNAPVQVRNQSVYAFNNWFDPLRNDESLTGRVIEQTSGGQPALQPETSENYNAGIRIDIPFVENLSLTYDYYKNNYLNGVGSIDFDQRVLLYPEQFTRGPNLPDDPAGVPGPIIAADLRWINIASSIYSGYDIGATWLGEYSFGTLNFATTISTVTLREQTTQPGLPPSAVVHADSVPRRATTSLYYSKGAWQTGVFMLYADKRRGRNRNGEPNEWAESATRWDFGTTYDFGESNWTDRAGWFGTFLAHTSLAFKVFNIFDERPALNPNNGSFLYDVNDPRQRRYQLTLQADF